MLVTVLYLVFLRQGLWPTWNWFVDQVGLKHRALLAFQDVGFKGLCHHAVTRLFVIEKMRHSVIIYLS